MVLSALVQIALGIIIANLYEWLIHKYILHGLGKKKKSFWSSHWRMHHKKARKNDYFDDDYLKLFKGWNEGTKEILSLVLLSIIQIPSFFVFPWYSAMMIIMALAYFLIHRKSHLDPMWAKKWAPWHYDHHMGKNQDANWCVTFPLWDHILGTRVRYINTKKVHKDVCESVVKSKNAVYNINYDIVNELNNDRRAGSSWKNDSVQLDSYDDRVQLEHTG